MSKWSVRSMSFLCSGDENIRIIMSNGFAISMPGFYRLFGLVEGVSCGVPRKICTRGAMNAYQNVNRRVTLLVANEEETGEIVMAPAKTSISDAR